MTTYRKIGQFELSRHQDFEVRGRLARNSQILHEAEATAVLGRQVPQQLCATLVTKADGIDLRTGLGIVRFDLLEHGLREIAVTEQEDDVSWT